MMNSQLNLLKKMDLIDGVWAGSFEISISHCVPDASKLSMDEFLHQAVNWTVFCACYLVVMYAYLTMEYIEHLREKY